MDLQPTLTEFARKAMLEGRDDSPIKREGDNTYCYFDEVRVDSITEGVQGMLISYRYRGEMVMGMRTEGPMIEGGNALYLTGLEGRIRISVTG
jgi:hypothetical protein